MRLAIAPLCGGDTLLCMPGGSFLSVRWLTDLLQLTVCLDMFSGRYVVARLGTLLGLYHRGASLVMVQRCFSLILGAEGWA